MQVCLHACEFTSMHVKTCRGLSSTKLHKHGSFHALHVWRVGLEPEYSRRAESGESNVCVCVRAFSKYASKQLND